MTYLSARLLVGLSLYAVLVGQSLGQTVAAGQEIEVNAKKVSDMVVIDVSFMVQATPKEAWDVLTDYERMPQFLPNLQSSKIIARTPTQLKVAQKGGVSHGPISLTFEVVREVDLKPFTEILSRVVSGTLKKVDSTTRLAVTGEGTRVTVHSESIPNVWVPPGIGPAIIEGETRDQFNAMRDEILKRKEAARK